MWYQDDKVSYEELLSESKKVGELMSFLSNSRCSPKFFLSKKKSGYDCTISGLYLTSKYSINSMPIWLHGRSVRGCFDLLLKGIREIDNDGLIYHEVFSEKIRENKFRGKYSIRSGAMLLDMLSDSSNHKKIAFSIFSKPSVIYDKRSIVGSHKWDNSAPRVPYNNYELSCIEEDVKEAIMYLIHEGNIDDFLKNRLKSIHVKHKDVPSHTNPMDKYYYPKKERKDAINNSVY